MVQPIGAASAALVVVGEGLLVAGLLALRAQARHLDDARPSRFLLAAALLVALGVPLRATRYATGTFGFLDTALGLVLSMAGWGLAYAAVARLPGVDDGMRKAGLVLVATAVASVLLQLRGGFSLAIQLSLGIVYGALGATLATVGWRLRAAGARGLVPALAVAAAFVAAVTPWARALVIAGAQAGDATLIPVSRLVLAGGTTLAALLAWPAAEALARHVRREAPAQQG